MKKPDVMFTALGGGDSIGGSCYLVRIENTVAMIDAGAIPNKSPTSTFLNINTGLKKSGLVDDLAEITTFVLSHAHTDHSGLVPSVYNYLRESRKGKAIPYFYSTKPTQLLLDFVFRNMLDLSEDLPYSSTDAKSVISHFSQPEPDGAIDWLKPQFGKLALYPTSHLLGSAMVHLEVSGRHVLYTGDLQMELTPTLPGSTIPSLTPDLLIVDGTYATANSRSISGWDLARKNLHRILDDAMAHNGKVLLPCFALGRAQDILTLVLEHAASTQNSNYYVYLDGQAKEVTADIYEKFSSRLNSSYRKLYQEQKWRIRFVDPVQGPDELFHSEIRDFPTVIIASSGMLIPGSASHRWASMLAELPSTKIVATGYLSEDIAEELLTQGIFGGTRLSTVPVQLPVSGHVTRDQTIELVRKLQPKVTAIVHCGSGDLHGPGSLESELRENDYLAAVVPNRSLLTLTDNGVLIDGEPI